MSKIGIFDRLVTEVSQSRYDELISIETKYNQLFYSIMELLKIDKIEYLKDDINFNCLVSIDSRVEGEELHKLLNIVDKNLFKKELKIRYEKIKNEEVKE